LLLYLGINVSGNKKTSYTVTERLREVEHYINHYYHID